MNNPRSVTLLRPILGLIIIATIALGAIHGEHAIGRAQPTGLVQPPWLDRSTTGSVCSDRYETLFGTGHEDLSQIVVLGLQDCGSLENHFDEDLEDPNPLVVSLTGDQSYDFATLRSLSDESTRGGYTISGPLPSWMSFDSEYGVLSASPSCDDQGSYLLEQNIAPGDGPGSINPLFVNYEVSCPSTLSVAGLGVISPTEVTQTGRFDYTLNISTIEINRPVRVRENKGLPYDVHVLTNKQDVDVSIVGGGSPYITATGNRLDFLPPDETEGDSGTLELMVCDSASPSDCSTLYVPWEITGEQAQLAGYSTNGAYDTVTHPNVGGGTETFIDVPCDIGHTGWIIPEEIYKGQGFEGFNMPPGMGVDSNDGRVGWNTDCGSFDYPPGTQVSPWFEYGNSGSLAVAYEITNPSGTQSDESRKPGYR